MWCWYKDIHKSDGIESSSQKWTPTHIGNWYSPERPRKFIAGRVRFPNMTWEQLNKPYRKKIMNFELVPYTKVDLKQIIDLNGKAGMGEKLHDCGKDFQGYIQFSPSKKKDKIDWTDLKFTTFYFLKAIIKMKSQATDWEKILQIYIWQRLVFRMSKELITQQESKQLTLWKDRRFEHDTQDKWPGSICSSADIVMKEMPVKAQKDALHTHVSG